MTDYFTYFRQQQPDMLGRLRRLVELESFSRSKQHVDLLVEALMPELRACGAERIRRIPQVELGDFLLATWNVAGVGAPILILCHLDTVYPIGTLAEMPIRQDGSIFAGPGSYDMKAGIVIALTALQALHARGELPPQPIHMLLTSDEEIGSPCSEALIKQTAAGCGLALVMEPATAEGSIKTQRKGGGNYLLTVEGRAAHAGTAPQAGINAIVEFAQQALEIQKLNDLKYGTSVSLTKVQGGTAGNVIPAQVQATIDTRVQSMAAMRDLHQALSSLYPKMPGAKVRCERVHHRPPMERQPGIFERAAAIALRHGVTLYEGSSGGGSDGNFTAAMGLPTLDGMGAHGDGAHAPHEHVIIDSLPRQATVVAALLREW